MSDWVAHILPIAGVFLLAGAVKGVVGLGLPTIAMGLLGLLMPPAEAAGLLVLPSLVTNIWQLMRGPHLGQLVQRLWPMMLAVIGGTVLGVRLIVEGNAGLVSAGLGAALIVYAMLGLLKFRTHVAAGTDRWLSPVVGATTWVLTGATGVFVISAVPYLASLGFDRDDLVQALGLSFTVSTLALALGLTWNEALPIETVVISSGAVLPALLGMAVGAWLRRRVAADVFLRWFFCALLVLGVQIIWKGMTT